MAYLMNISFDLGKRIPRDIWYFEYKGVRFKLVQNNSPRYADVLLTIAHSRKTRIHEEQAYQAAAEFLSAVSWANSTKVKLCGVGGPGVSDNFTLRKARCSSFTFHQLPFSGMTLDTDISLIPKIETEQQRIALSLFRDAYSTSENFLAFLLYWQVLEINLTTKQAGEWIDKVLQKYPNKFRIDDYLLRPLNKGSQSLGECLKEDFRNAIAHIRRKPGRRSIKLDSLQDGMRISAGVVIMEQFCRFYITEYLKLEKNVWLARVNRGFPMYIDEPIVHTNRCQWAYKLKYPFSKVTRKPRNRAVFNRRRRVHR